MRMYQRTDQYLKKLKKQIRNEFNHLIVLSFDELNAIRVRKETESMWERFLEFNHREYIEIAKQARKYANSFLKKKQGEDDLDYIEFVDTMLTRPDPVTEYRYDKEAERKRLRLSEGINAVREVLNRPAFDKLLKRSANLWYTQSSQYPINIEDEMVKKTWKDAGIKKVRWITMEDEKVCDECWERHNKIFDIDNVPVKHYNCRCYLRPVK